MRSSLALIAGLVLTAPAHAAIFTVNHVGNESDEFPGNGICAVAGIEPPRCTLRAAIEEANAVPGEDVIEFSIGPATIQVSGSALPTITDGLIIDGTTALGYDNTAIFPEEAPPSIYLSGAALGGSTRGLRSSGNHVLHILALGVVNFPGNGIEVSGATSARIDRNWIGLDRTGAAAGNGGSGLFLQNCVRCLVGQWINFLATPTLTGIGNLVSSNAEDGIYLVGGEDNRVGGNLLGLHPGFSLPRGNGRHGIQAVSPGTVIGNFHQPGSGSALTTPNYMHHNAQDGIHVFAGDSRIHANDIRGNARHGVYLFGANNFLGALQEATRNWINANGSHGVVVAGLDASGSNWVRRNSIWDNAGRGVHVTGGTASQVEYNAIWDNGDDAVRIDADGNTVFDNDIGLAQGMLVGNAGNGVVVNGDGNTVRYNRIGGMGDDGIDIVAGADSFIWANRVGVTDTGEDIGNANVGIRVRAAADATLLRENVVGFNVDGLRLEGPNTRACGNQVGLTYDLAPAGNLIEGIRLLGNNNVIGDPATECAGNRVGHNASDGIQVEGGGNLIRGNQIGAIGGLSGTVFGNGMGGVLFTAGAFANTVDGNVVHANGSAGIRVAAAAGLGNRIERNSFRGNTGLAIDLLEDGITPNDWNDEDEGPNRLQNFAEITGVGGGVGMIEVSYAVDTLLARGDHPLTVDFYVNGDTTREGEFVHRDTYGVAPGTVRTISFAPTRANGGVMAMVTDASGNSSELGAPVFFSSLPLPEAVFRDGFED